MAFDTKHFRLGLSAAVALAGAAFMGSTISAQAALSCPVSYAQLKSALTKADTADKTGFNNHFWGVVVNRQGVVCAVAFSGESTGSQWLGSRQIAAAKAFTANAFSLDLPGFGGGKGALSTGELYQFVQPSNASVGNPLFNLDGGNVLDSTIAYQGQYSSFGTTQDPMIGFRVGGTITFGGGLPLYTGKTTEVGGLGLSGDTACADHSTAWRTRINLGLASDGSDAFTFANNASMTNGHPECPNDVGTQGTTNAGTH